RRGEAKAVARRVAELVESGEAEPGEIVLLFAAGTDAEMYEEALRAAGLPTYRATGRGYFGQQQVVDLLAYLRLLHDRYDHEALVTVPASPFRGFSPRVRGATRPRRRGLRPVRLRAGRRGREGARGRRRGGGRGRRAAADDPRRQGARVQGRRRRRRRARAAASERRGDPLPAGRPLR